MKVFIICSKKFYSKIEEIKKVLEKKNIKVFLPNCYDDPTAEQKAWDQGAEVHQKFKAAMYKQSEDTIREMDAVLVLNLDKEKAGETKKITLEELHSWKCMMRLDWVKRYSYIMIFLPVCYMMK